MGADMKLPAIQFYPGDWHRDVGVQSLTLEERGAWFEILLLMHDGERRGFLLLNGRPIADETLANYLRCDLAKLRQIVGKILANGVASRDEKTGALYCRRMVKDEHIRHVRSEAGSIGGYQKAARTAGKSVANPTPSSSSSLSTSSSEGKKDPCRPMGSTDRSVAESLMEIWNLGRPAREQSRLTPKRLAKIAARIKDGFGKEELETVVRRLKASGFHNGDNDRGWKAPGPEWVLNSTEKVEQWLSRGDEPGKKTALGPRSLSEIDGQQSVFAGIDKLVPSAGAEG